MNKNKEPEKNEMQKELDKLKKELETEKSKSNYVEQIPENQKDLPKGMQQNIMTEIINFKDKIKTKMDQLRDLATMEVMLDPFVRAKKRLKSITDISSAEHLKIDGHWKTIPPEMHITKLQSKKISSDHYEITFGVFDIDENNNKRLYCNYIDVIREDGIKIKRLASAEYKIVYEVKEIIQRGKPIQREIMRL